MFDEFSKCLPGGAKVKPDSRDYLPPRAQGDLTEKDHRRLSGVFEDQPRGVTGTIIDYYPSNAPRYEGKFGFELSETQLETLNAHGRLDLMQPGYHDFDREGIRISKIEASEVEPSNPPETAIVNVGLTYCHEGVSRLRRGGRLYLFRTGRYRVWT